MSWIEYSIARVAAQLLEIHKKQRDLTAKEEGLLDLLWERVELYEVREAADDLERKTGRKAGGAA